MAYITLSNANRIIFQSNLNKLDIKNEIYKIPIYFFNKYEINNLLAIQELLIDPEKYFKEYYIPYEPQDSYTFIYEGKNPSYHADFNCPRLRARYENFIIPEKIREKGKDEIIEFRKWFETVKHLLETPDIFVMRLQTRWGIVTNPNAIKKDNSGAMEVENLSLTDIESQIDAKIKSAGRFYNQSEKNKSILSSFSKLTYLAYKDIPIENNHTGLSDKELKSFLKEYDNEYKKPLKYLLINYYRIKHNPEIKMEGFLLEKLGFKPCAHCHELNKPVFVL